MLVLQAILVVNDAARDALPEELKFAIVLTIFESKGLEFDDILLYNFFKDSQVSSISSLSGGFKGSVTAYSHCTGAEPGQVQDREQWVLMCCTKMFTQCEGGKVARIHCFLLYWCNSLQLSQSRSYAV